MSALYQNKFRVETSRLRTYDYSADGIYYVTICTRKKIPYFGEIKSGKMILSDVGAIIEKFWLQIPSHFPSIFLDDYIVMPDHIHAILIIDQKNIMTEGLVTRKPNSIGVVINQFKRICTVTLKTAGYDFVWQPRFHDHIIRTQPELHRIRKYIAENPSKWDSVVDP